MTPKKNSGTNCCVVGCKSRGYSDQEISYYRFPRKKWERERRQIWRIAVRRQGNDGKLWEPSKTSMICSLHFEGGQKSNDPRKNAYNPTIFPDVYNRKTPTNIGPAESLAKPQEYLVLRKPVSNAEKCKNYRDRKKQGVAPRIKKTTSTTSAERSRNYRLRKKQLAEGSKLSANEVLNTPSTTVADCTNTTTSNPEKMFISVPTKPLIRKKWLQLARRDPDSIVSHSNVFMCEDHFDMEKDTLNYKMYKMGFSQRMRLADNVMPSKLYCQKSRKRPLSDDEYSGEVFLKQQGNDVFTASVQSRIISQTESLQKDHKRVQEIIPIKVSEAKGERIKSRNAELCHQYRQRKKKRELQNQITLTDLLGTPSTSNSQGSPTSTIVKNGSEAKGERIKSRNAELCHQYRQRKKKRELQNQITLTDLLGTPSTSNSQGSPTSTIVKNEFEEHYDEILPMEPLIKMEVLETPIKVEVMDPSLTADFIPIIKTEPDTPSEFVESTASDRSTESTVTAESTESTVTADSPETSFIEESTEPAAINEPLMQHFIKLEPVEIKAESPDPIVQSKSICSEFVKHPVPVTLVVTDCKKTYNVKNCLKNVVMVDKAIQCNLKDLVNYLSRGVQVKALTRDTGV